MSLVVTGLNHTTAAVELREKVIFTEEAIPKALAALRKRLTDAGVVILSTCNRTEVYAHQTDDAQDVQDEIRGFLAQWNDLDEDVLREVLYEYREREAVGHLFRVASSLDSMVVGEQQILGQVHDAYLLAHREQATDKVLNALFQRAFSAAKRVRAETNIGSGKVSVSSVAVDLAVSIFMDLSDKTVMVVGAGEMGELTLKALVSRGVGKVLVANRSLARAESLAAPYDGKAVPLADLDFHLHRADILLTSTGAPGVIIQRGHLRDAVKRRGGEPIFVIDIAVPRDVDRSAQDLDNVYLYDIDDLQEVADQNMEARRAEVGLCLEIIEKGVDQFCMWRGGLAAQPTIVSLAEEFNSIRGRELKKSLAALPDLNDKERAEVEYLTKRIVNTILQQPITQLKNEVHQQDAGTMLQLVRRLFGLSEGA